jgi:hypothetical protein
MWVAVGVDSSLHAHTLSGMKVHVPTGECTSYRPQLEETFRQRLVRVGAADGN